MRRVLEAVIEDVLLPDVPFIFNTQCKNHTDPLAAPSVAKSVVLLLSREKPRQKDCYQRGKVISDNQAAAFYFLIQHAATKLQCWYKQIMPHIFLLLFCL